MRQKTGLSRDDECKISKNSGRKWVRRTTRGALPVEHLGWDARVIDLSGQRVAQEIALGEINKIKKEPNLATIAIVGENMKHTPGIAGKLFGTLGRSGINVIACAQGASETNISFVVSLDSLRKTLNVLHDSFFLSDYQVLNIFIAGVGLIGSNLLEQIRLQQAKLMKENSLQKTSRRRRHSGMRSCR